MTDQDHLDRINALTRNARQTWFALLAALVFVGITLMGVEHIDFYGVDRATKLPIVNFDVPTRLFFIAAPMLTAAIYGYFHLYLIRLWDALDAAPSHVKGMALGDAIDPWLVGDAALRMRARLRKDNSATTRSLEDAAMLLNLLLAWVFGVFVLGLLWWLSMPARDFPMTAIAGASLLVSAVTGAASFVAMWFRLGREEQPAHTSLFSTAPAMALMIASIPFVLSLSFERTAGASSKLEPVVLAGENIVLRPPGWLGYRDARADFRARWCAREKIDNCTDLADRETEFNEEFFRRRQNALSELRRPYWHRPNFDPSGMDFRRADLSKSFLAGVNLIEARLDGVSFFNAELEGAFLEDADLEEAELMAARMEGAFLSRATLQRADLSWARMDGAVLRGAKMESALLFGAQLENVDIDEAQLEKARFDYSRMTGTPTAWVTLENTNIRMSANEGGMLRYADLSQTVFDDETDFRNVFLDNTVSMTNAFRIQMGYPCQWADTELSDAEFFGRWRGWVEAAPYEFEFPIWRLLAPEGFADVAPIAPPQGCTWSIGALPKPLAVAPITEPTPGAD